MQTSLYFPSRLSVYLFLKPDNYMRLKTIIFHLAAATTLASCGGPDVPRTEVVAHRGYWAVGGSAQNSIASLAKADSIGVWGSECDVYLCADDVLMVNHDHQTFLGNDTLIMEDTPSSLLQQVVLANGEPMPLFSAYLDALKQCRRTKLIIELKSHALPEERQKMLAARAVEMVKDEGLRQRVEYIAFSRTVAEEVIRVDPAAKVAYLSGDLSPAELKELGYTGLDYHISVMRENEAWFGQARELGLEVNVWTVNDEEGMLYLIGQGANFITTDEPAMLQRILETSATR